MADNDHGKKFASKHGFVERFFRVTPTKNTAFVSKLYEMVNDEKIADLISWSGSGDRFIIYDNIEFSSKVLPQYFKHCNWSSFVRQLNMYDFHKMNDFNKDEVHNDQQQRWEFKHQWFTRQGHNKLHRIKRKTTKTKHYFHPDNHEIVERPQDYNSPLNPASDFVSSDKGPPKESNSPEFTQTYKELPTSPGFPTNSSLLSVQNTITQLTCTVESMQFKLDSTTKEVLYLRQITAKQQKMLDDVLSLVSTSKPPSCNSENTPEPRKPKKIHELLGNDDLHPEEANTSSYRSGNKRLKS